MPTDREILERAARIVQEDAPHIAAALEWRAGKTPDPPQPPGKTVRIAVAIDPDGRGAAWVINRGEDDFDAMDHCTCGKPTHRAIITAVIPPYEIPVVAGKVEGREP
jgi:hypothetical protein